MIINKCQIDEDIEAILYWWKFCEVTLVYKNDLSWCFTIKHNSGYVSQRYYSYLDQDYQYYLDSTMGLTGISMRQIRDKYDKRQK